MGIEEPDLTKQHMQTKNSPSRLQYAMQWLTDEQSQLLDRMGFGGIRRLQIKELPGDLSRWLVKNFDVERSCLKMKDYDLPINKMVLHRIFGLPCGGKPIRLPSRTHQTNPMVKKWRCEMGLEKGSVSPHEVAHDIVQNNDKEKFDWFMMQLGNSFGNSLARRRWVIHLVTLDRFPPPAEEMGVFRLEGQLSGCIGQQDALIVGPGVLGRLVAEEWKKENVQTCFYFRLTSNSTTNEGRSPWDTIGRYGMRNFMLDKKSETLMSIGNDGASTACEAEKAAGNWHITSYWP